MALVAIIQERLQLSLVDVRIKFMAAVRVIRIFVTLQPLLVVAVT